VKIRSRKRCYLHIGTHKTGTTSLQAFLSRHEHWFARRGVHYTRTGRTQLGNHNLAWQLYGDPRFERRFGTVEALHDELRRTRSPIVAISSEDLCLLHDLPDAIEQLTTTVERAGFEPVVVLDVRPQVDYVESLYASYARFAGRHPSFTSLPVRSFDDYANEGLWTGKVTSFRSTLLEYDVLVDAFAAVVGHDKIIVRPYTADAPSSALLESWLNVFGTSLDPSSMRRINSANVEAMRPSFSTMFRALDGLPIRPASRDFELAGDAAFHAFTAADIDVWVRRFAGSNERLSRRLGVRFTAVTDMRLRFALQSEAATDDYHRALRRLRDGIRPRIPCSHGETQEVRPDQKHHAGWT
jgi:hypothetical protein